MFWYIHMEQKLLHTLNIHLESNFEKSAVRNTYNVSTIKLCKNVFIPYGSNFSEVYVRVHKTLLYGHSHIAPEILDHMDFLDTLIIGYSLNGSYFGRKLLIMF